MTAPNECPAVKRWGDHLYVRVRGPLPWRITLRCWRCDLAVREPGKTRPPRRIASAIGGLTFTAEQRRTLRQITRRMQ